MTDSKPKVSQVAPPICPECKAGKCVNCTARVLDDDDQWTVCLCECLGGKNAWL